MSHWNSNSSLPVGACRSRCSSHRTILGSAGTHLSRDQQALCPTERQWASRRQLPTITPEKRPWSIQIHCEFNPSALLRPPAPLGRHVSCVVLADAAFVCNTLRNCVSRDWTIQIPSWPAHSTFPPGRHPRLLASLASRRSQHSLVFAKTNSLAPTYFFFCSFFFFGLSVNLTSL